MCEDNCRCRNKEKHVQSSNQSLRDFHFLMVTSPNIMLESVASDPVAACFEDKLHLCSASLQLASGRAIFDNSSVGFLRQDIATLRRWSVLLRGSSTAGISQSVSPFSLLSIPNATLQFRIAFFWRDRSISK